MKLEKALTHYEETQRLEKAVANFEAKKRIVRRENLDKRIREVMPNRPLSIGQIIIL